MGWNRAGWGNDWGAGTAFASVTFNDDIPLYLGTSKDAALEWNTSQTQDAMMIALSGSNSLIVGTQSNIITNNRDLGRGADTYPSLIITSNTSWASATDEWVAIWHNGTNAVIDSGKGSVVINDQVIAATTIIPDAANANALGATDAEFLSLYLGEDANSGLFLGLNQDWRLWYDETTLDALILSEGAVVALAIKGSTITDFKALTGVDGNDVFIRTQSALDSDKRGGDIRFELGQQHGSGRAGELNIGDLRWFSLGDGLSAADAGFQWDGGNLLTKSTGVVQTTITQVGIGSDGVNWELAPATSTITAGSIDMHHMYLGRMTVSAATALTCDNAATLYIDNAPVGAAGAGPSVLTNAYAQWTAAGATRLDGTLAVNAAATITPGAAVDALTIDMVANDANAISINTEAANNWAVTMTAKYGMYISCDVSDGGAISAVRNNADAETNALVLLVDEHADVTQNCLVVRSDSSAATTAAIQGIRDAHAVTATDGIQLYNRTAATDGVRVQMSPRFVLRGQARKTTATAESQIHLWSMDVLPAQGTTATTSAIRLGNSNDGGAYAYPFSLTDTGILTLTGGTFMGDNVPTMWGNTAAAPDAAMFSDGTALVIGFDTSTDTTLKMNNAAIANYAGAADVAGASLFLETQGGGAVTSGAGLTGGTGTITAGAGSVGFAGADNIGGVGGGWTWVTGAGGAAATSGPAVAGGAGGPLAITLGLGGAGAGGGAAGVQGTLSVNGQLALTPATAVTGLFIDQDNVAYALDIDHDADNICLNVNSAATTVGKYVAQFTSKTGVLIDQSIAGGRGLYAYRNHNSAEAYPLVEIVDDHASVTQHAFSVRTDATAVTTAAAQLLRNGITTTSTDALLVENSTASTEPARVQMSPRIRLHGEAWRVNATAASQTHDWIIENLPAEHATVTTSALKFGHSQNGAGYTYPMTLSNTGSLTLHSSADSAAVADQVGISRFEIGGGNTVLALSQETAVAVEADETKMSHKMQCRINGSTYFIMLTTT